MKLHKLAVAAFIACISGLWPALALARHPGADQNFAPSFAENFDKLLRAEDYAGLETLVTKWNPKRNADGDWDPEGIKQTLDARLYNRDWDGNIKYADAQRKRHPKSPVAALIAAYYWTAYAWNVRGNEYVAKVDPFAQKLFIERMKHAERILLDSRQVAGADPFWYEIYLNLAVGTRRSSRFIERLFDEAIDRHGYHYPFYMQMANYWFPKSGAPANWPKLDSMIDRAAADTSPTDGISMYARLYGDIIRERQSHPEVDLFLPGRVSWVKMRKSFEDLVRRYPTGGNLNKYAAFSCRANDRDTFLTIRRKIVDVDPSKWPHNFSAEMCERRFLQYKY